MAISNSPLLDTFTYETELALYPGQRVVASFAQRMTIAYVAKLDVEKPPFATKKISKVIDDSSYLTQEDIKTALEVCKRYLAPPGKVFDLFFPPGRLIKTERFVIPLDANIELRAPMLISKAQERVGKQKLDEMRRKSQIKVVYSYTRTEPRKNLVRKVKLVSSLAGLRDTELSEPGRRVVNTLLAADDMELSALLKLAELKSRSPIDTLQRKGVIEIFDSPGDNDSEWTLKSAENLTTDQHKILSDIKSSPDRDHLIYGITGSGKTEIYFKLMDSYINRGKQALLLVPEVSLTPQLLARVRGHFPGREVRQYHSYLTQSRRQKIWLDAVEGNIDILVGTRSAVWVPMKRAGIIVVDEEHDSSFFQQTSPHYDALEVARIKGKNLGIPVIAGSATPRVKSFYEALGGSPLMHRLATRPFEAEISVEIVDMRETDGFRIISKKALAEIEQTITRKGQCFVFTQRKGFSNYVVCTTCGNVRRCDNCDVGMTFHRGTNVLKCHYCGRKSLPPSRCDRCESATLVARGFGTERVEHELRRTFPSVSMMRMDRETITSPQDYEKALRMIESGQAQIVVGTKMISKGLDFPRVDLVLVVDSDRLINIPRFDAAESAFQTLFQVAGRGSRGAGGHTVVQTFNPANRVITALEKSDYELFYNSEVSIRKELNYPPYAHIADIVVGRPDKNEAEQKAAQLAADLTTALGKEEAEVLGPVEPLISRIRNSFRQRIIVKFPSDSLMPLLRDTLKTHLPYSDVIVDGVSSLL